MMTIQSLTRDEKIILITQFFKDHKVLTLSYISDGEPENCALWYANDGLNALYFLSSLTTNHRTTLQGRGNVAYRNTDYRQKNPII